MKPFTVAATLCLASASLPALAVVSDSIRKGGSGKWGPVPMPAQPALSDADVKTLATWVLGGAK